MASKKEKEALKRAEEIRIKQLEKVIKKINPKVELPEEKRLETYPTEYKLFLKEIRKEPKTFYEKAGAFAERILNIQPDPSSRVKLEDDIRTAYLNVSPGGVMSLTFLTLILVLVFVSAGYFLKFFDMVFAMFILFGGLILVYVCLSYPSTRAKALSMKMNADIVLAVLYMVIYMRNSPNMEGAIKFAAQNLSGPLSWDLKKLLWDVELGVYPSMDLAVVSYINKWKDKNKEFSESMHLLRGAVSEAESRREAMFDESIDVILNGTRDRMRHYAQDLRMPVMLVHAMGVMLPVMGLVMFPIVVIMMSDVIKPVFIFIGYDIVLPAFLFWYMSRVLESKPPTFSQPDISQCKDIPPLGKVNLFKKTLPVYPFALAVSLPLFFSGFLGISLPNVYASVNYSLLIILSISLGITVYCFLDSYQKIKVRRDVERIENEFAEALFQLGNQVAGGTPIEVAVDRARENLKSLKISDLFLYVSMNMKKLGMTFEQALFDKEYGAIWHYPSRLITSVMQTVIESSEKGVKLASMSMLTISRYLKGLHNVREEIGEILGETTTSMRFLAMFLAPLVAGVTVTMAVIMIRILTTMQEKVASLMTGAAGVGSFQGMMFFGLGKAGGGSAITPVMFQLIVGLYMVETILLLSMFINKIEYGEDEVGLRDVVYKTLIFGIAVYILSWIFIYAMFGTPLQTLLIGG